MFVEKLTKEDIEDYLKKYIWPDRKYAFYMNTKTVNNFEIKNGQITCNISNFDTNDRYAAFKDITYIYYTFRDFTFSEIGALKPEIKQTWLEFMYSKFGEEYKKAFLNYRANGKDVEIEKTKQKYDQQTKDYLDSLDNGQGK
ncbi:MAG: hypothetical protein J5779_01360 [Clostridia bacterium]|nr:hypothetical protein [Clostridia bacterium]